MERHHLLPDLEPDQLAAWIIRNSVGEPQQDERKTYYSDEEKAEMEHESSNSGRELGRLKAIEKQVKDYIKKGNLTEKPITIVIPVTIGVDALDRNRSQNYSNLEKGYDVERVELYRVPNPSEKTMEFFSIDGNHFADRTTGMSQKEIRQYCGLYVDHSTGAKFDGDGVIHEDDAAAAGF